MTIEWLDDDSDARVADYREVRDTRQRREGLFIAESRIVVRRLAASRFRIRSLLLTPPALASLNDVVAGLDGSSPVYVAREEHIRKIVGFKFHRGCLAVGERGEEPSVDRLLEAPGPRVLVVLDDLADPDNVGGVFRNARAFGTDAVLLAPGCADPLSRKAIRVSVGGSLCTPFARLRDWPAELARLQEAGYTLIALTPCASAVDITELGAGRPIPERVALLLGNEGRGLATGARAAADLEVRIVMAPGGDSLNVATASGIALHRLVSRGAPSAPQAPHRSGPLETAIRSRAPSAHR